MTYSAPFKEQVTKRSRLGQLIRSILPEHTSGKVQFDEMLQRPCEIICEDDAEGFVKVTSVRLLGTDEQPI